MESLNGKPLVPRSTKPKSTQSLSASEVSSFRSIKSRHTFENVNKTKVLPPSSEDELSQIELQTEQPFDKSFSVGRRGQISSSSELERNFESPQSELWKRKGSTNQITPYNDAIIPGVNANYMKQSAEKEQCLNEFSSDKQTIPPPKPLPRYAAVQNQTMCPVPKPRTKVTVTKSENVVVHEASSSLKMNEDENGSDQKENCSESVRSLSQALAGKLFVEKGFHNRKVAAVAPIQRIERTGGVPIPEKSIMSSELAFLIKDLKNSEFKYVEQLSEALKISEQLTKEGVPQYGYKFFGFLDEIWSFHKKIFMQDLEKKCEMPKYFILCFVNYHRKFDLYIQRQWIIPDISELDSFEQHLYKNFNLEPYLTLTTKRVYEYGKILKLLQAVCQKDKNIECRVAVEEAIKIINNLQYQVEKVDFLRKVFGTFSEKLKECGRIMLEGSFKIAKNGGKNRSCIVYLCENLLFFADPQTDGYQYIDSVLTLQAYCCTMDKSKHKFKIGIKGGKSFILTAESHTMKEQWCKQLRKILKPELFDIS